MDDILFVTSIKASWGSGLGFLWCTSSVLLNSVDEANRGIQQQFMGKKGHVVFLKLNIFGTSSNLALFNALSHNLPAKPGCKKHEPNIPVYAACSGVSPSATTGTGRPRLGLCKTNCSCRLARRKSETARIRINHPTIIKT